MGKFKLGFIANDIFNRTIAEGDYNVGKTRVYYNRRFDMVISGLQRLLGSGEAKARPGRCGRCSLRITGLIRVNRPDRLLYRHSSSIIGRRIGVCNFFKAAAFSVSAVGFFQLVTRNSC